MSTFKNAPVAFFLLLALLAAAATLYYVQTARAIVQYATVLPQPAALPEFRLVDQHGRTITRDSLRGNWHVLFFGFTHCPDICPATLQQLALARARVLERQQAFPDIILVSVDPERDTPQTLAAYVSRFGAGVMGLTGDIEQVSALTSSLGIFFAKSGDLDGNYSVDHSAAVLLLNENAEWHALFSAPHNIDAFVHDLPILTNQ